ncbi:TPA: hypothetical protein ACOJPC_003115 [Vibrio fluvialis]|uniref:hypothetical protein n=1 Tax=Vibrio fluvialis TaxID=676 RepID=UPI001F26B456|nr:hypothetical protein [Vibrio fluvialis]MCE7582435.1 hypothetical protein [Vibrio fluvialis]WDY54266.1 hypothetical protein PUN47_20670 [Vibrio fluvialis]
MTNPLAVVDDNQREGRAHDQGIVEVMPHLEKITCNNHLIALKRNIGVALQLLEIDEPLSDDSKDFLAEVLANSRSLCTR